MRAPGQQRNSLISLWGAVDSAAVLRRFLKEDGRAIEKFWQEICGSDSAWAPHARDGRELSMRETNN